ncbi:hypothetical protein LOC54_07950 [Acetobacter sp. AN02]|uniref:hypothetical protein n=1 Tax=Acetobacter sp. AN02 TaxID=2894186 RepID=UPI0024346078|nr:hypothetical protein [Acetobacter sp. AN02]MDG6095041.1 hypothetical protein [Acetobacter sp. AN02]
MWKEPYLETCCRSALRRLHLAAETGRPHGLRDEPCLKRLTGMRLAREGDDERFRITQDGEARHEAEILSMARRHSFRR